MYLLNFLVLMVEEEHKQISTMSNICLTDRREAEATNGLAQPVEPLCSVNRMQTKASNINSQPVELTSRIGKQRRNWTIVQSVELSSQPVKYGGNPAMNEAAQPVGPIVQPVE